MVCINHQISSRWVAARGNEEPLEAQEGHGSANFPARELTIERVRQILKLDTKLPKV